MEANRLRLAELETQLINNLLAVAPYAVERTSDECTELVRIFPQHILERPRNRQQQGQPAPATHN